MARDVYYLNEEHEDVGITFCDFCDDTIENKHLSVNDSWFEAIENSGWYEVGEKHICDKCYASKGNAHDNNNSSSD